MSDHGFSFYDYDDVFSFETLSRDDQKSKESLDIQSEEAIEVNNKEQNDIISRETGGLYSLEDDGGSFEDAAGDGGGEGGGTDDLEAEFADMESDFAGGDDGGGDSGGGDFGGGDEGGGDDGFGDSGDESSGGSEGTDVLDSNKGSSLNPFTQINQKLYLLETLNGLRSSVKSAVDQYKAQYAEWSEVKQLAELADILDDERRSFIMQQNPENMIKLGLYHEQYDRLVQNISKKISKLAVNDKQ